MAFHMTILQEKRQKVKNFLNISTNFFKYFLRIP